jgi:hypothetical protein
MIKGYDLPRHVLDAIERKTADADVQWVGRPDWRTVLKWGMLTWCFAVPWTLFSVFWTLAAAGAIVSGPGRSSSGSWFVFIFPLWGLPFIGVGIAMLASPFYLARTARNTAYVVTTDAIMTIAASRSGTVTTRTLPFGQILSVEVTEKPSGYGTLKLHKGWRTDSEGDRVRDEETLVGIPEAAKVAALINSMRPGFRAPST